VTIDSKAMRKLGEGLTLFLAIEVTEFGTAGPRFPSRSAFSAANSLACPGRTLLIAPMIHLLQKGRSSRSPTSLLVFLTPSEEVNALTLLSLSSSNKDN